MIEWGKVALYMLGYSLLFFGGLGIGQFVTKGLLTKLMRLKMFGRRKGQILLKVHSPIDHYYKIGKLEGSMLRYRPRNDKLPNGERVGKLLIIGKGVVTYEFGVPFLEVDEQTNNVLTADFKVVAGHDAELTEGLFTRIAMLRKLAASKEIWILIIVVVVGLICIYNAFQIGNVQKALQALIPTAQSVATATAHTLTP